MRLRTTIAIALVITCALLVGCGGGESVESSRTAASGTVTFDGQPLPGGCITLTSAADPQLRVSAMLQPGGKFQVADAPKGAVQVTVETETLRFGAPAELYVKIPARYDRVATSGLTATIDPAGPPLLFELKSQ